jgi:hypothetical protein
MELTVEQSVIWMRKTADGWVVPVEAKVVNVLIGRVVIRGVKKGTGEVYFKAVEREQLRAAAVEGRIV